jgi:glycosyltransferase involved in cell wall biosynthesis
MRIAINGWFWDQLTTGSGQYLAALLEWLPRVGASHDFILIRPAGRGRGAGDASTVAQQGGRGAEYPIPPGLAARAGNTHTLHARTPFDNLNRNIAKLWFEQVAFPRACWRLGADVAFVPYWGSPWWAPCPVVVTIHDLIPLLLPLYRGGPLQRGYTWLVSRTARRAAAVLTDSEASKRDIVAHLRLPPECVHTIHLAADPRYHPVTDPAKLARVRAKYNLPDEPFLLYVGGFDARKNVVRTIQAFARMVNRYSVLDIRLVVAGKLPERDTAFAPDPRAVAEMQEIGHLVHLIGWVDEADKPALYSLALGTVFVSEYEGFGLVVVEGMGCGGGGKKRESQRSNPSMTTKRSQR